MKKNFIPTLLFLLFIILQFLTSVNLLSQASKKKNVGIFLYDNAILFDYAPAAEIFRVAGHTQLFNVFTIG